MDYIETIVQLLAGSLYTGIFGSHLDSKTKEIRDKILGRFVNQKSPVNHDIERAVYRSYLQSTLIVAEYLLAQEKKAIGWKASFVLEKDAAWYDEVVNEIRQELIILDKPDFIPSLLNNTNIDVAVLLRPYDNAQEHKVQNLRQVLEGAIVAMLEDKFGRVPAAFLACIREGWQADAQAERQYWFSYVCAFFANELKSNNRLQSIFQGQILADLHLADIPLNLRTIQDGIERLIEQAYPDMGVITDRLDRQDSWLQIINQKLDALNLQTKAEETGGGSAGTEGMNDHTPSPELLTSYLRWMEAKYDGIRLPAIRENAGIPALPLDRIYVALRVRSKSTSMDVANAYRQRQKRIKNRLQEAGIVSDVDQLQQITEEIDQNNPMPRSLSDLSAPLLKNGAETADGALDETDHAGTLKDSIDEKTGERIISLGTAFCEEPNLVILGDPGSGKSTLTKWLTIHLARSMRAQQDNPEAGRVKVKAGQVDMDHTDPSTTIDLGPCRLPVFVTIADYSRFYATANPQQRGIIDYLGMAMLEWDAATRADCNRMIRYYLAKDQAVVILDGMDEVVGNRADILREIEYFQKVWIECCGRSDDAQEDGNIKRRKPGEEGGNQLVVTSRVVGYHAAPLSGEFRVMTVEKMTQPAVQHFCDLWMEQVFLIENANLGEDEVKRLAKTASDALKAEIYDPKRPAIQELATNPLLVTNLAMVFRFRNGHLPDSRAELYEQTLAILLQKWRTTSLPESEMRFVLAPLAAHIHASPGDDIRESELRTLIRRQLAQARGLAVDAVPVTFDEEVEHFIAEIRQNVGLISERGDKLYHFLHRTFQEYLSAMFLLGNRRYAPSSAEIDQAVVEIRRYWDDPIWHEVVLLSLGIVDSFWSASEAGRLFSELLLQEDPLRDLLPRTALFLAKAIPEMQQISNEMVVSLLNQLLTAYNGVAFGEGTSVLTEEIEVAVERLFNGARGEVIRQEFGKIFSNSKGGVMRSAALHLANRKQLWSGEWLMPLSDYMAQDEGSWNTDADALLKRQFSSKDQVVAPRLRVRERLISNQEQWHFVTQNPGWVRLITVFFGGWAPDPDIDRFVSLEEQRYRFFLMEMEGVVHTEEQSRLSQQYAALEEKGLPDFSATFVYREAPFTREILQALAQRQPVNGLLDFFRERWEANASDNERVYALLGLLALGADIAPQLAALEMDPELRPVFDRFINHLDRLEQLVRYPAIAISLFLRQHKKAFFESSGLKRIPAERRRDILETINKIAIRAGLAGNQFSNSNPRHAVWQGDDAPAEWPAYLQSNYWAAMTASTVESPLQSLSADLETFAAPLHSNPALLLDSLLMLPDLAQMKVRYRHDWPMPKCQFVPRTTFERVRQALGIVLELDGSYDSLREWFVVALQPYYREYPQLLPYAVAVGLSESTGARLAQLPTDIFKAGDVTANLLHKIQQLESPADRFWALYPIARRDPNSGVFFQMLSDWKKITDARDRLEGLYYLLELLVSGKYSQPKDTNTVRMDGDEWDMEIDTLQNVLIEAVRVAITNLTDPADRLRANLYLADLDGNKDKEEYVFKAMALIPALDDDLRRRRDLLYLLDKYPEIGTNYPEWPSINKSFSSGWDRNIALQKNFLNLLSLDDLITGDAASGDGPAGDENAVQQRLPGIWAGLTLYECCTNLRKRFRTELFSVRRFLDLIDPDKRDEALQHILRIGAGRHHRIDRTIVTVINQLLELHDRATITALLPVLHQPEIDAWPMMKGWGKVDLPILGQFYQLLRAEAGQYDQDNIEGLADLLSTSDDGLRGRARLALQGDRFGVGNEKIRTSCIGWEAMVKLGERMSREKNASIAQVLGWTNHNVFYDDPEFIDHCIEYITSPDAKKQSVGTKLISGIHVVSYPVWQNLIHHLGHSDSKQVQVEIMCVISRLAYRMGRDYFAWQTAAWDQLLAVISDEHWNQFSKERFQSLTFDHIIQALQKAGKLEGADRYAQIACAKAALSELTRIPVAQLPRNTAAELFAAFHRIGSTFSSEANDYQLQAITASQQVRDEPVLLPILFDWALGTLDDELVQWDSKDNQFGGELALLAANLAEQLSDSFSEMVDRGFAQPLLLDVGKGHPYWIARQSALIMLTCLQPMHQNTIQVLESAMQDVNIVQKEAIRCIPYFRSVVDQKVINRLVQNLAHPSGLLGRSSAQILTAIATNDQFNYSLRRQVAEALAQQIRTIRAQPAMQRLIFMLSEDENARSQCLYDGNLESALLIEMMKVSGHL